ncbi:hypothetical protein BKA61DRAFT_569135 [Leptodontidium sp. MPI-SDFR-AT-0119]|nr:hypothetical protein BKA61DRAFT_569135 [Leptodontidium sp. MPI-SDFR-AT-0119]
MVSNTLRVRYSCRGSSSGSNNASRSTRVERAAAPKILPEDVFLGQIFWNREDHPGARTIVCVREDHCGGRPMATGAYGHPVLVVRLKFDEDGCEMAKTNKRVLVLGLTSFGQMTLSEWVMSARNECMDALPVIDAGSSLSKAGRIASDLGWIKLDGYTLLSLLSGQLHKQTYVLPRHIYSLSVSQLAPYQSATGGNDVVRLDETSYRMVMAIIGLEPESYTSVLQDKENIALMEDNVRTQEDNKKLHESPVGCKAGSVEESGEVEDKDDGAPTIKVARKGKKTTISGKGLSKEAWALFARLYSSDWEILRADVAHRKFRLERLKRRSTPETQSGSKRPRSTIDELDEVADPKPVRRQRSINSTSFTLRQRLRWSRRSWAPMNCRKTISCFWAELDPIELVDWGLISPGVPVPINLISKCSAKASLEETQRQILTSTLEILLEKDPSTRPTTSPTATPVVSVGETISPPSSSTTTLPLAIVPSSSAKPIDLEIKIAGSSSSKSAPLIDRKRDILRPRMRIRRRPRNSCLTPPVGSFISFERSLEEHKSISNRAENMGFRSHGLIGATSSNLTSVLPSQQVAVKTIGPSTQNSQLRPILQYEQGDWERWVSWAVLVYIMYSLTIILMFLVDFVHRVGCGSDSDRLD